jgi:hypothetical protein
MPSSRSSMLMKISRRAADRYQTTKPRLPQYNSCADFDWIRDQSGLPWMQLPVLIPTDMILREIDSIRPYLVEHRDDYAEHRGWKSFCLHGKSHDATREDQYYQDDRPFVWVALAQKLMPNTVEFFRDRWPGSGYRRVRAMLLEPGGYITLHKDTDHSRLSPINIAITQPTECKFIMEHHGIVPFEVGSVFWLDISNNHTVYNDSDLPRWHIIVHQNFERQEFQNMVVKCYHSLYSNMVCDKQP